MRRNRLTILISIILFTSLAACSDSSSGPDVDDENGQASFSISGDFQASYEGEAFFASIGTGGLFTANLTITDDSDDSFSLVFTTSSTSSISVPAGTYTIGFPESDSPDGSVFIATLTDFTGNVPKIFQIPDNNAGTLTVTRSTDRVLDGTFQFDAIGDSDEEVTIEGSYSAIK